MARGRVPVGGTGQGAVDRSDPAVPGTPVPETPVTGSAGDALSTLTAKVQNQPYTVMSPYPGLDQPISLQSWGHQLKLADAGDPRIDQFIAALRVNSYTHPEPGASCNEIGPQGFRQDAPPPFQPIPDPTEPGVRAEVTPGAAVVPDAGTVPGTVPTGAAPTGAPAEGTAPATDPATSGAPAVPTPAPAG